MNKLIRSIIAITLSLLAYTSVAWAQEFTAFEGKGLRQGDGGAKKTIDGVDFWSEGSPPYKFQVIGVITDRRHKTGLVGKIRMASLEADIASLAKANGGDGVILASAEAESVGAIGMGQASSVGSGQAFGIGASAAVQKQNSKYLVVKYFREEKKPQATSPQAVPLSSEPVDQPAEGGASK